MTLVHTHITSYSQLTDVWEMGNFRHFCNTWSKWTKQKH